MDWCENLEELSTLTTELSMEHDEVEGAHRLGYNPMHICVQYTIVGFDSWGIAVHGSRCNSQRNCRYARIDLRRNHLVSGLWWVVTFGIGDSFCPQQILHALYKGPIPSEFGLLHKCETIDIRDCGLTGSIVSQWLHY